MLVSEPTDCARALSPFNLPTPALPNAGEQRRLKGTHEHARQSFRLISAFLSFLRWPVVEEEEGRSWMPTPPTPLTAAVVSK